MGNETAIAEEILNGTAYQIRAEGPIYLELLLTRIARAHGFGRIGGTIRETIIGAIDPIFPTSGQGDLTVLWPEGLVKESTPFRYSATTVRALYDIPDVELIGLARELSEQGMTSEQVLQQMITELGIARLAEGTKASMFKRKKVRLASKAVRLLPSKNA